MGILSGKFTKNTLCRVVFTGNKEDCDIVEGLTAGKRKSPIEITFTSDIYFIGKVMEQLPGTVMDKNLSFWYEENACIESKLCGCSDIKDFFKVRPSGILLLDRAFELPELPKAAVICPFYKADNYEHSIKYGMWYTDRAVHIAEDTLILDETSFLLSKATHEKLKDYIQKTGKNILFLVYDNNILKNHEILWRMLNIINPYRFSNYKTFLERFYECYGSSSARRITGVKNEAELWEYVEPFVFNYTSGKRVDTVIYSADLTTSMRKTYDEILFKLPEGKDKAKDYLLNFLECPAQYGYEWASTKEMIMNSLVEILVETGNKVMIVTNGHNQARRFRRDIFNKRFTVWQADRFMNPGFQRFILKEAEKSEENGAVIIDSETFYKFGKISGVNIAVFMSPVGRIDYGQNYYVVYNNAYDKEVLDVTFDKTLA